MANQKVLTDAALARAQVWVCTDPTLTQDQKQTLRKTKLRNELLLIKSIPEAELLRQVHKVDWAYIARTHVIGRTDRECFIRWTNNDSPTINHSSWTKVEDAKLFTLSRKYEERSWEKVAMELNTNRTPFQCLQRYQRSLNNKLVKGKWTAGDDAALAAAVDTYGCGNWQQVANHVAGRTGQQCMFRWVKAIDPSIRRGKFTKAEDTRLCLAVEAYTSVDEDGAVTKWANVSRHVPGRTDVQCRERWVNVLNPNLTTAPWSEEEDERLMSVVERRGAGKWTLIAADMSPRTDNQCWRRWKMINTEAHELYQNTVYKRKKEQQRQ
eukprot:TRINITY_DN7778_c0_g1_i1.p1 TRINITY_DN7778_c0_g1~~TRINITY_DN7778_c0_g1_i1.p1  ORF type:complete len:335 (+),score=52.41 TRINITY_DN7778_c0_g1_i1:35-1006(+)